MVEIRTKKLYRHLRISLKYFLLISFYEQLWTLGTGISLILESDRGHHRPQEGLQGDVIHQRHVRWQTVKRLRQCGSDVLEMQEGCSGALASTLSTVENHNYTVVTVVASVISVTRPRRRAGAIGGEYSSVTVDVVVAAERAGRAG
jgi:hypothetical protein